MEEGNTLVEAVTLIIPWFSFLHQRSMIIPWRVPPWSYWQLTLLSDSSDMTPDPALMIFVTTLHTTHYFSVQLSMFTHSIMVFIKRKLGDGTLSLDPYLQSQSWLKNGILRWIASFIFLLHMAYTKIVLYLFAVKVCFDTGGRYICFFIFLLCGAWCGDQSSFST